MNKMDEKLITLINRVEAYNAWRRGADTVMPDPVQLGADIDAVIDELKRGRREEPPRVPPSRIARSEMRPPKAELRMDKRIKSIHGLDPDLRYTVGAGHVSKIVQGYYAPEAYCKMQFYEIYMDGELHSVVNDQAVAEVIYARE